MVELPNRPETAEEENVENPRTVMKKDRKNRVAANLKRQGGNKGEEVVKKTTSVKDVVTKRLAQRLRKSKVGKTLGAKTGRRR